MAEKLSLFVGPENDRDFGPEDPKWVPESLKWNRAYYYSLPTDLIAVASAEEAVAVDPESFNDYKGVPGVWALYSGDTCLDVHETCCLATEMKTIHRQIQEAKDRPWEDKAYTMNPRLFSRPKRHKAQSNWENLRYLVVAQGTAHKLHRELLEAQFAWNEKSVYWNRNYYQPVTQEMVDAQLQKLGFQSVQELVAASEKAWEAGTTHVKAVPAGC